MLDALRGGTTAQKFEGIEFARFVLAAAVVVYHYVQDRAPGWVVYGRFAVESFFVISGFVVARAAARENGLQFLAARFGRLWPALLVCSLLTAVVAWRGDIPWLALLRAVAFVPMLFSVEGPHVDSVYWSLVIEMRFYFWIAVLLLVFRRRPNLDVISAVWLVASACAIAVPALRSITLSPYSAFFIFGLLFESLRGGSRWAGWLMWPAIALAGWQAFVDFERMDLAVHGVRSAPWVGYAIAVGAIAIPALAIWRQPPAWLGRLSSRTLGPISYPLYLLHAANGVALVAVLTPVLGWATATLSAAALALAAAWAVSTFVEPWCRRTLAAAFQSVLGPRPSSAAAP